MLKSPIGAACASVLVALAGGIVTPTASHAATYGGVFDPDNGNYRWFGNHVFTVDNACLNGDGWKRVNPYLYDDGSYCGNASLIGGDLTVVNKQLPLGGPEVSKTLQFSNFPLIVPTDTGFGYPSVWGVYVLGGQLVGVDTEEIGAFTFDDDPDMTHEGNWYLRWTSGNGDWCALYCGGPPGFGAPGALSASSTRDPLPPPKPDVILRNSILDSNDLLPQGTTRFELNRTDIPEPNTVALVLAALGAGWLTRRRKR